MVRNIATMAALVVNGGDLHDASTRGIRACYGCENIKSVEFAWLRSRKMTLGLIVLVEGNVEAFFDQNSVFPLFEVSHSLIHRLGVP